MWKRNRKNMVAIYEDEIIDENPKTLCDWVKNFRIKKIQMKRKLRSSGNLRVCAILAQALSSAEHQLRRKQQERFNRWLEFQAKLNDKSRTFVSDDVNCNGSESATKIQNGDDDRFATTNNNVVVSSSRADIDSNVVVENTCKQREEITNLWKAELSGIDEFMRSMNRNNNNNCTATSITVSC